MAKRVALRERPGGHVFFSQLLRSPYEAMLVRLHAGLAAAGYADSRAAWGSNMFHYLRGEGLRLTGLAERCHTSKQAMRYTVNQLEEAGYVERVPDPADRRAKVIRLTERGRAGRQVADDLLAEIQEECVRRLGEEKMRQFEELMRDVSAVLEEHQEGLTISRDPSSGPTG